MMLAIIRKERRSERRQPSLDIVQLDVAAEDLQKLEEGLIGSIFPQMLARRWRRSSKTQSTVALAAAGRSVVVHAELESRPMTTYAMIA